MVTVVVVVMATVVVVIVVVMEVVILEEVVVVKEVVVLALMPVIALVEAVVVTVGLKDLVGAGGVIDTLVGVLAFDALMNMVNAVEFTLGFARPALCSVYVLPDGAVDLPMNTVAGVLIIVLISGLPDVVIDVLVDVTVNVFAGVMTVNFVMPAPLEGLSCGAAFDCRPMAALNCDDVLQAWMPPYQV